MNNLAIIILAAGQSSRLGQPKQLVNINKEPLLLKQCQLALSITPHVYSVLGFQFSTIKNIISFLPVNIINNHDWELGMSSSIVCGLNALPSNIDKVMIVLVDQWQLNLHSLELFLRKSEVLPNNIHVCKRKNEENHFSPPCIFPRVFFDDLKKISGEKGAKNFILANHKQVKYHVYPEAFVDLDDSHDLSVLRDIYPT